MSNKKLSGKALVIQLDRENIRIAQMTLGAAMPQISQSMVLATPEGAVEDGVINSPEPLRELLKSALAAPEWKRTRRVVFSLCTTQVISETAAVPAVNEAKLGKLLESNMDLYFPVDVQDYHVVWEPIGPVVSEDGVPGLSVQIWAVPNALLVRYYALANACGLTVAAIDWCGHSMAGAVDVSFAVPAARKQRAFRSGGRTAEQKARQSGGSQTGSAAVAVMEPPQTGEPSDGADLYLLAEPEHLLMTFVENGQVKLQRLLHRGNSSADELSEAQMVLEYYNSLGTGSAVLRAVLCGTKADEPGCAEQLCAALNLPVRTWNGQWGPEWCLCVGASRTQLDFGVPEMNQHSKAGQQLGQAWQYGLVLAGGVLLVGSLLVTFGSKVLWSSDLNGLETTQRNLQIQAAENAGNAQRYYEYSDLYDAYSGDWNTLFASLRTYNDNLVLMLDELEDVLPSGTRVVSIGIANEGLGLQFSCSSKEEAAYLIIALRNLQYASLDAISQLTMTSEEGPSGQDMLPSLAQKLAADAAAQADSQQGQTSEAAPTEGGYDLSALLGIMQQATAQSGSSDYQSILEYAISSGLITKEDLENALADLTPEELETLEAAYGVVPATSYSLEELLAEATFEQRKAALETMLTSDPVALYRFYLLFQEDMTRPAGTEILFNEISGDLWDNAELLRGLFSGDPTAAKEAVPVLLNILTKDETTLAATEELIQTDSSLTGRYAYYLAVEMGLQEEIRGIGDIDFDQILHDIINGTVPDNLPDTVDKGALEDALGSLTDALAPEPDSDAMKDIINGIVQGNGGDTGNDTGSDTGNDFWNDFWNSIGSDTGSNTGNSSVDSTVSDYLNQIIGSGSVLPSGADSAVPGSEGQPAWDGRYYFSVALGYKPALIEAELERKGLTYDAILKKLEVLE